MALESFCFQFLYQDKANKKGGFKMNLYNKSIHELCEYFCKGINYDKYLFYPVYEFCKEWKRNELSKEEIERQVTTWTDNRHLH